MSFAVNPLSKVGEYRLEHMAKKKIPIDQIGALRFAFRKSSESHKSHPFCHWSFKSMLTVQILFKRIVIPPKYLIVSWRIQSSKSAKEIGILLSDNPSMMACLKNWGFPDETFGFKFQVPSSKFQELPANNRFLLLGCSSYWTTDSRVCNSWLENPSLHLWFGWSSDHPSLAMPTSSPCFLFRSPGTSLKPISFNPRWRCFGAKKMCDQQHRQMIH